MSNLRKTIFIMALAVSSSCLAEKYSAATGTLAQAEPEDSATARYIKNLGGYLGYDLETDPPTPVEAMLDYTLSLVSTGQQMLNALFASIPVNSLFGDFTTNTAYDTFNSQANILFQDYTSPNSSSGISVVENFDQKTYQQDPVSQYVINLLGTPDWSNCSSDSGDSCLSIDKVMTTVLADITKDGKLPGETSYYSYDNNSKFSSQLNSNVLLSPLVYSASGDGQSSNDGLPSSTQVEQAQDFIRYVTESVMPMATMTQSDYSTLFAIAYPPTNDDGSVSSDVDATNTLNAKIALAKYLLSVRVFAAKASVATSNLYHIFSKRVVQKSSSSDSESSSDTSQALNELQMATWRLYDPNKQNSDQWVQKINTATPATVQKEIAVLLSEISYQLYLNRQEQERMLLTQSVMLIQGLAMGKPSVTIPGDVDTGNNSASN